MELSGKSTAVLTCELALTTYLRQAMVLSSREQVQVQPPYEELWSDSDIES